MGFSRHGVGQFVGYTGIVTYNALNDPSIASLEELAASKEIGVVLRSDVSTGVQILVNILLLCNF